MKFPKELTGKPKKERKMMTTQESKKNMIINMNRRKIIKGCGKRKQEETVIIGTWNIRSQREKEI